MVTVGLILVSWTLLTSYSTCGLLYWIRGRFSCKKCLFIMSHCSLYTVFIYLAEALSFFPFIANVNAILFIFEGKAVAPGPVLNCWRISRVDLSALNDIFERRGKKKCDQGCLK